MWATVVIALGYPPSEGLGMNGPCLDYRLRSVTALRANWARSCVRWRYPLSMGILDGLVD